MTGLGGGSFKQALSAALVQGLVGAAMGGVLGGAIGAASVAKGSNIWNGRAPLPKVEAITLKPAELARTGTAEMSVAKVTPAARSLP